MKQKNIITTCLFGVLVFGLALICWCKPSTEFSESERRLLTQKPELTTETLLSGEFMDGFETYVVDQFPARDAFRSIKANFALNVLGKMDNNGLYYAGRHLSKIEYPLNPAMVDHAEEKFDTIYESFLKDKDVNLYLSLIPDKNYFLGKQYGYLSIDYDHLMNDFAKRMDYMQYIDIVPYLSIDDYYRTDSHWKQEKILDVAEHLAGEMGVSIAAKYNVNTLEKPFSGVYSGQSAMSVKPDTIKYLTNNVLSACSVTYYNDQGKKEPGDMYNLEKGLGKDPYELYLSGTTALAIIDNPNAKTDQELVVFRDSFGSSIVPLLVPGYKKITVIDIRYLQSDFIGHFVKFTNQDVLFLYSTSILNNSMSFR